MTSKIRPVSFEVEWIIQNFKVRSNVYSRFSPIAIDKFTQEDESNYCRNLSTNLCDEFLDSGSCFLRNEYEFFVLVPLAQNAFYRKFFEQLS